MPTGKTYDDISTEFDQFKTLHPDDPTDLKTFARQMDALQGTPGLRKEAYNAGFFAKANSLVDRAFEATGVPLGMGAVGGLVGEGVDAALGTKVAPVLEGLGEQTPRMLAEGLLTVPEAASGVGAPVAAATWLNRLAE